eukprot:scaffold23659_cov36-Tisochrysis_lutea.AAC.1
MVKLTGGVARRAPIDLCYHNAIGLVDTDGSKAQGGMRCARGARAIAPVWADTRQGNCCRLALPSHSCLESFLILHTPDVIESTFGECLGPNEAASNRT